LNITLQVSGQASLLIFIFVILVGYITLVNVIISSILVHFDLLKDSVIEMRVERGVFAWKKERDRKLAIILYNKKRLHALEHGEQLPWPPLDIIFERCSQAFVVHKTSFVQRLDHAFVYRGFSRRNESEHWSSTAQWFVVHDASPFNHFVQGVILANAVAMALDTYRRSDEERRSLALANIVFTAIFALEMVLKVTIVGFPDYFNDTSNRFDALIAVSSVIEVSLASNVNSLSILRVTKILRLARIARLAKLVIKWRSLREVIYQIGANLPKMIPIVIIQVMYCILLEILSQLFLNLNLLFTINFRSHVVFR